MVFTNKHGNAGDLTGVLQKIMLVMHTLLSFAIVEIKTSHSKEATISKFKTGQQTSIIQNSRIWNAPKSEHFECWYDATRGKFYN